MRRHEHTYTSNLVAFARALRDEGLSVSTDDLVSAGQALRVVDPIDRDQFYYGLKATVVDEPTQEAVFDELFAEFWDELADEQFREEPSADPGDAEVDERVVEEGDSGEEDTENVQADPPETPDAGDGSGSSPDDFSDLTERRPENRRGNGPDDDDADVALEIGRQEHSTQPSVAFEDDRLATEELGLLVKELGRQLGALRGFRRRVQPSGTVDLRRSLDVVREQNPDELPKVEKERSQAKVRFFVDVSHSMIRNMRQEFLFFFLFECMRQFTDVRIFMFDTDTTEVTRHFQSADIGATVAEMRQAQTEWGAGTKIGASIADILSMDPFVVDRDTTAIVVSDGWDAGDHDLLRDQMQALDRRCQRVLWFNPRASVATFEPKVSGMQTALPYVDHLFGFGDVSDLRDIVERLRSQSSSG